MGATVSLIGKDLREHGLVALMLALATLCVLVVALASNANAAYGMSPFEVVRFSLLSFMPLVALIVGNRLVVREYLSHTRLFVEALPLSRGRPLLLKFLLGMCYLGGLVAMVVFVSARVGSEGDDITADYLLLVLGKSLAIIVLYWSIVFCFSLCGHLRLMLYAALLGLVALMAWWPVIDARDIAPFALLDGQLFAYERDLVPWSELFGTLALSLMFTVAGFVLAVVGEGSVAERLARPMTRRDIVALAVLLISGAGLVSALLDRAPVSNTGFTSDFTVRSSEPFVAVFYQSARYEDLAAERLERLASSIAELQSALGVSDLPVVRLALAPELERNEVRYSTADGVRVDADWRDYDSYDLAVLDTVVIHGVLGHLSGERASFGPEHWLLDGVSRWWIEQSVGESMVVHEEELIARVQHALQRSDTPLDLIDDWQLIADRFAYPTAEAMAWSAIRYLEESAGREAVLALARGRFGVSLANNSVATLREWRRSPRQRFAEATGVGWLRFDREWRKWVAQRAQAPGVQRLLASIPPLEGVAHARFDDDGIYRLQGDYRVIQNDAESLIPDGLVCVMKHDLIGPFDVEIDVDQRRDDERRDVTDCEPGESVHDVGSRHAPGQRVYVGFDVEGGLFHQPLRLNAQRLELGVEP